MWSSKTRERACPVGLALVALCLSLAAPEPAQAVEFVWHATGNLDFSLNDPNGDCAVPSPAGLAKLAGVGVVDGAPFEAWFAFDNTIPDNIPDPPDHLFGVFRSTNPPHNAAFRIGTLTSTDFPSSLIFAADDCPDFFCGLGATFDLFTYNAGTDRSDLPAGLFPALTNSPSWAETQTLNMLGGSANLATLPDDQLPNPPDWPMLLGPTAEGGESALLAYVKDLDTAEEYCFGGAVNAVTTVLPGNTAGDTKVLLVLDKDLRPDKRKLLTVIKDPDIVTVPPGLLDPIENGATITLKNPDTLEEWVETIPGGPLWKGLGKPAGKKGWKYLDKDGVNGPCKLVLAKPSPKAGKPGLFKAVCLGKLGTIPFTLDEASQGKLVIGIKVGEGPTYCSTHTTPKVDVGTPRDGKPKTGKFLSRDVLGGTCDF
jgi:hypothetical protein